MASFFRLSVLVALAGCSPVGGTLMSDGDAGAVVAPDAGAQPLLELGTGTQSFTALTDDQTLTIIAGPQGGFHLWAAARTRAPLDPMLIKLTVKVKLAGAEVSSTEYKVNLVKNGPYSEWYAMTALVDDPAQVRGKRTVIELIATDSAGRTATDSRTVIPAGP